MSTSAPVPRPPADEPGCAGDESTRLCDEPTTASRGLTRRDVVRQGMRLAFTAPVITTFLASEAQAAASRQSCYPALHECGGPLQTEQCCNGACAGGFCP